jgi:mycothiol system anti-sigma-R factor
LSEISCSEVLAEIERFIDGELPSERSRNLAEHLAACTPCLDRADFQRGLKELLRRKCSAGVAPEHLLLRVRTTIHAERLRVEADPPEA